MKFLSKVNLKNKIVLLRADLNSNVVNGRVLISERIKQAAETIKLLKRKKARLVIIAHQGQEGKSDFLSLRDHSKLLSKITKVKFIEDLFGERAESAIKNLKSGEAILLENLRFYKEEFKLEKNKMVKNLSAWCDIYVNDAFSVAHRKQASIISFPKYMKAYAGPLLESELNALRKIKLRTCLYVLGGAKPEDNIKLLGKNKVLACGLFGQSCLVAKGKYLGAQNKYLKKEVGLDETLKRKLKSKLKNVITPLDFAVNVNGKRKELLVEEFPSKYEIFDIGTKTINLFVKEIKKAKAVYMKGPAGAFAFRGFSKGTNEILRAIANSRGFSLIGGGHLSDAIEKSGISKNKFSYISLSGGALLRYIAGEKLPGVEALR